MTKDKELCHNLVDQFIDGVTSATAAMNVMECHDKETHKQHVDQFIKLLSMCNHILPGTLIAVCRGDRDKVETAIKVIESFSRWGKAELELVKAAYSIYRA